jgi:hypothetical protein
MFRTGTKAIIAAIALCALSCVGMTEAGAQASSVSASTGYFNTYTTVATLGNANGLTVSEGFAAGTSYTYSVKINGAENKADIYRTRMSDGSVALMTNGDNKGSSYVTYLGHANDVVLTSNAGNYYMFIVTLKAGSASLVKLRYVGTTYYKVGSYTIKYKGANAAMSGVKIISKTASTINFLFKTARTFYRGSLGLTATSGTINLTSAFALDVADAPVDGKTVPGLTSYTNQGFGYYNNVIYFPLTKNNVSIVLVYRNVSGASGTIKAATNLSFRVTSQVYSNLFEIESVGIGAGNHLWFGTNRRKSANDTSHDAVLYFNGYTAA